MMKSDENLIFCVTSNLSNRNNNIENFIYDILFLSLSFIQSIIYRIVKFILKYRWLKYRKVRSLLLIRGIVSETYLS